MDSADLTRFLWVQYQLDFLSPCRTPAKLENAVEKLPKTIEDTYSAMLHQIKEQDRGYARNALLWLSHAGRPLSIPELCEVIVFEDDPKELDDDHRLPPKPEVIQDICPGLISIIPDTQKVALAHLSVRKYLASLPRSNFFHIYHNEAREFVAKQCLRYINFPAFSGGFCDAVVLQQKKESWPLLHYAALHWQMHVKSLGNHLSQDLEQIMHQFFESHKQEHGGAYGFWLRAVNPNDNEIWWEVQHTKPLFYFAFLGSKHVLRNILKSAQSADIDALGGCNGWTALQAAVFEGHHDIVKLLLQYGANPNTQCFAGPRALSFALYREDAELVRLLKDAGAAEDPQSSFPTGFSHAD